MKGKCLITIFCIVIFLNIVNGENNLPGNTSIPNTVAKDTAKKDKESNYINRLKNIIDRRNGSLDFYTTMIYLQDPSTVSGYGTNWNINSRESIQKRSFLMEADIKVPIGIGGKWFATFNGNIYNAIVLTPEFYLRIFQNDKKLGDSSYPVRTPSFLPRITYYFTHKNLWNRSRNGKNFKTYFGISLFHHSNGQDGDEFYPSGSRKGQINTYNGNFAEDFVYELLYGNSIQTRKWQANSNPDSLRDGKFGRIRRVKYAMSYLYYYNIGFEKHPSWATDAAFYQYRLYGTNRINMEAGRSNLPSYQEIIYNGKDWIKENDAKEQENWRLTLNATYIAGIYNSGNENHQKAVKWFDMTKRLNIYMTYYWRIVGTPNTSLFAQAGYWGSDDYNIFFQQNIWQFRFGIALAFFKYPLEKDKLYQ